jgi:hypothetical protein
MYWPQEEENVRTDHAGSSGWNPDNDGDARFAARIVDCGGVRFRVGIADCLEQEKWEESEWRYEDTVTVW